MAKIYCDMNIYNRIFDDQNQLRIRLETIAIDFLFAEVERGNHLLFWSFILADENRRNPYQQRRQSIEVMSNLCGDNKIYASEEIRGLANNIQWLSNARPKDALHIACADYAGCDYFITCDDKLIKTIQLNKKAIGLKVKVMNPVDFIRKEIKE